MANDIQNEDNVFTRNNPYLAEDTYQAEQVNPFMAEPEASNSSRQAQMEVSAAAIAAGEKSNPAVILERGMWVTPEEFESDVVRRAVKVGTEGVKDELVRRLTSNPEDAQNAIQEAREQQSMVLENLKADNILSESRAFVEIVSQGKDVSPEDKEEAAVQHYMMKRIAEVTDQSILGSLWDLGGIMAIPDLSYNMAELKDRLGQDAVEINSVINSGEYILKMSRALNSLPPEQRVYAFEAIVNEMQDLDDNEIEKAIKLLAISGKSSEGSVITDFTLDKLDAGGITYFLGTRVISALKNMNAIHQLGKAKNIDAQARLTDAAASSDDAARKIGTPRQDAAASVDPSVNKDLEELFKGAPQDEANKIREKFEEISILEDEATNISSTNLGLSDVEKAKAVEAKIKFLKKQNKVKDASAVEVNENSYRIKVKVEDEAGNVYDQGLRYDFTVDDVTGGFKAKAVSFVGEFLEWMKIASPNFVQGADRDLLVAGVERVLFGSDKFKKYYSDALGTSFKGLNKEEVSNVNKVLLKGDDDSRIYSYDELVNGNGAPGGLSLTAKEFEAYASVRKVVDDLQMLKNAEVRKAEMAAGTKEVTVGGKAFLAKPYDAVNNAWSAYKEGRFKSVFAEDGTVLNRVNLDDLKSYYEKGYKLVRSRRDNDLITTSKGDFQWTLVKPTNVRNLPPVIIKPKAGYIPRIYKDSFYFVKTPKYAKVDGMDTAIGTKTLRYFDNKADADEFAENLVKTGEYKKDDVAVLSDRQTGTNDFEDDIVDIMGGLYTSPRKSEQLTFGPAGVKGTRQDAIEALQGFISHVGNRVAMGEYRLGLEKRWLNHARNNGVKLPAGTTFEDGIEVVKNYKGLDERVRTKLKNAHRQILFARKVHTVEESRLSGVVSSLADWMSTTKAKRLAPYLYRASQSDPLGAIRGSTFNLRLGMYNMSQFVVQMLGASIAVSINPTYAMRGFSKAMAFSTLDQIHDPIIRAQAIKKLKETGGADADIAEAYEAWRKTGMYDSVISANGDLNAWHKGLPVERSVLGNAWNKFVETGQLPFKVGELTNMRISYATAYERWKDLNKGRKLDDKGYQEITQRAENYRLNMSRANKAEFQKGLLSIPTQFWQVYTKYIEAVLGSQFTAAEKTKMMLGQFAFFGTAGVPFADHMFNYMLQQFEVDTTEVSEEDMIKARRGFIGWAINDMLDTDALVTGRVAIASGLVDTVIDFATEPKLIGDVVFGATGTTVDGVTRLFESILDNAHVAVNYEDVDDETLLVMAKQIGKNLVTIPSSGNNVLKARMMYNAQPFRTKAGDIIWMNDSNLRDALMQSLGFSSQDMSDMYDLIKSDKNYKKAKRSAEDAILSAYVDRIQVAGQDNEQLEKAYDLAVFTVLSSFDSPKDRKDIMEGVRRRLKSPKTKQERLIRDALDRTVSEFTGNIANFNNLLLRKVGKKEENNGE